MVVILRAMIKVLPASSQPMTRNKIRKRRHSFFFKLLLFLFSTRLLYFNVTLVYFPQICFSYFIFFSLEPFLLLLQSSFVNRDYPMLLCNTLVHREPRPRKVGEWRSLPKNRMKYSWERSPCHKWARQKLSMTLSEFWSFLQLGFWNICDLLFFFKSSSYS